MPANSSESSNDLAVSVRRGSIADSYAVFEVFEESLADLIRRLGSMEPTSIADPEALARMWQERQSLYEHLAESADQFWLAERGGQVIGFARSIVRDDLRMLTEFFVVPSAQSSGLGRALLDRAFPTSGSSRRMIIASLDMRAQALYLRAGVYPRFPVYYFWRAPKQREVATDLVFEPLVRSHATMSTLGDLDIALLGHRRDADHTWLLAERQGYIYLREGRPVGYGYVGKRNGPFALLDTNDLPAALAQAESTAAASERDHFGLEVPMINRAAVDYLLSCGYRVESFMAMFMSDAPFGRFDHYIITSPPFIL
jgi:GNAT superfamily N-acetyltransferase